MADTVMAAAAADTMSETRVTYIAQTDGDAKKAKDGTKNGRALLRQPGKSRSGEPSKFTAHAL
jgi:hypothetical protein